MQIPYLTASTPSASAAACSNKKSKTSSSMKFPLPTSPTASARTATCRSKKRGISTMDAARFLARALGRKNFDIGYAGLKDTHAITTAVDFSLEHEENRPRPARWNFPRE